MRVRTGDTEVKVQGVVKTSNPGLGNGIDFLDMAPASRLQLQHYLETIPDVKAPEFIP